MEGKFEGYKGENMAASQDKTVVDQARGDKGLNYG